MFGLTVIFKPRDALIPGTKETEFSFIVIYPPRPIRVVNSTVPSLNIAAFIWNIGEIFKNVSPSPKVEFIPHVAPTPKSFVNLWSQEISAPAEYVAEK